MARTEDIEARLAAYVDGELDEAQRAQIEMHLSSNPQHRQLIEELIRQRQLLRQLPRAMAPPDIAESLTAQLERAVLLGDVDAEVQAASRRIGHWRQLRMAAAVLVLLGALVAVIIQLLPSPNQRLPELADLRPSPLAPSGQSIGDEAADRADKPADKDADRPVESAATADAGAPAARIADVSDTRATPAHLGKAGAPDQQPLAAAETQQRRALQQASSPAGGQPTPPTPAQVASNFAPAGEQMFKQAVTDQVLGQIDHSASAAQNALVYIVHTNDPQGTQRQLETVLRDNGVSWTAQVDPLPPPLELGTAQQQTIHASRFQAQQVQMKGDWGTGRELRGGGQSSQAVQTTERQPDASQVSPPPDQTQSQLPQAAQSPAQLSEKRLEQDRQAVHPGQVLQSGALAANEAAAAAQIASVAPQQIANRFEARRLTPQQLQAVSVALGPRARQARAVPAHQLGMLERASEESLRLGEESFRFNDQFQRRVQQPGRPVAESSEPARTIEPVGQADQAGGSEPGRAGQPAAPASVVAQDLAIATTQPADGAAAQGQTLPSPATMPTLAARDALAAATTQDVERDLIDVVIYVIADPAAATTQPGTRPTGDAESPAIEPAAAKPAVAAPATAPTEGSSTSQ